MDEVVGLLVVVGVVDVIVVDEYGKGEELVDEIVDVRELALIKELEVVLAVVLAVSPVELSVLNIVVVELIIDIVVWIPEIELL